MRLFIAIDIPEPVKDELQNSAALLRQSCAAGRILPRENFHITLAFLGEQPEARVGDIRAAMDHCGSGRFPVTIGGFGTFPQGENGVLWRGIGAPPALEALQRALYDQLRLQQFPLPECLFVPHLTLARQAVLNQGVCLEDLSRRTGPLSFTTDRITLMRSALSPNGAKYTPLYDKFL